MNWYLAVLKKYAVFSGRAHREEFWMFVLFNIIIGFACGVIDWVLGLPSILETIYGLGVLIPVIAVSVRRLHDTGRSGFWIFIGLVPILGVLALIYFYALDGESGSNQYGPRPS